MNSEIKEFTYPNGELQWVQLVRFDDWRSLDFLSLPHSPRALDCFASIYRKYLVPACPVLFGNMVMFSLPEDLELSFPNQTRRFGTVADRLTAAAAVLREGVRHLGKRPVFRTIQAKALWEALEARDCLRIVRGALPVTTIIPVNGAPGYLTETEPEAAMKVNASFFIMDRFDCATVYDQVGTHLGLCVKDGVVTNPPLFGREALLVAADGSVRVETVQVEDLKMEINGETYRHGVNATVYSRPGRSKTPRSRDKKLIIIGCRVAAVYRGASVPIPASGFVLCVPDEADVAPGDRVEYRGLENVTFGIQVGNSIVKNGEKTLKFCSRFYNIRRLQPVPFPPSLYPMDFNNARAARIALGADSDGKPMLVWAEGAGKLGYVPGKDSRGASLRDMADICTELGMVNGVNLDGGGSAQILLNNRRSLLISDRNAPDNSEAERPVPIGLILRG